jgi:hypothetical protein
MKSYKIAMFHATGLNEGQIRDEEHIMNTFQELGHTTFTNDESKIAEVDLILCFKSNTFGADDVKRWKIKMGEKKVPIWIWTFDNMDRFQWFYEIAKECDLWLGEELGRAERFKQEGIPFYYFPNHAVPISRFRPFDLPKKYDVMFSGTPYFSERSDMLHAIEDAGFDLHIFGNNPDGWKQQGFKNVHRPAFDDELAKVVSQSKITVGISNTRCYGYWSIRPAQVMLCKGFMIDRYCLGMERELRDGCEYWNTHEELVEKIKYYLEVETEREAIAQRGYEIATTTLTNKSRCAELIKLFENYAKFSGD